MKAKLLTACFLLGICIFGSYYVNRMMKEEALLVMRQGVDVPVVVLDAGHGGADPGKIGKNGTLEKNVNLSITKKVGALLEQNGIHVVYTRTEDRDLASEHAKNRKAEDMRARVELMKREMPVLAVSIHQNSYPSEECKGAQVFYYATSAEGKKLARMLQKQLVNEIKNDNKRLEKANKDYYLLKNSSCPFAIVECGFLSNPQEEELLVTEEYQEKVAFAIHLGILEYLNTQE